MHGIMYPKELGGTFYINPTFIYSNDRTCGYSLVVNEVEGEPRVSCSNPAGEAKRHKSELSSNMASRHFFQNLYETIRKGSGNNS
ncbi:hypothetical protein H5410_049597 [Solanum commersonii]|uniref:Uncharacterized protein n=1 Tax=Solanum commersonii TaxID=4109 RepID=A0A9J5WTC3_SOLCO|nr:hypothetical protein H5410_049597 [Solanum commersonii]